MIGNPLLSDSASFRRVRDAVAAASQRDLDRFASWCLPAFWSALFALYTLRSALLVTVNQWPNTPRRLLIVMTGGVLSLVIHQVLKRVARNSLAKRFAWAISLSIPAAVIFAFSNAYVFNVMSDVPVASCAITRHCDWVAVRQATIEYSFTWLFVFAAWGLLLVSLRAHLEMRQADLLIQQERTAAQTAQLRALRNQVDPHFLFNCLNSLGTLAERGDPSATRDMIGQMSSFLRYGLAIDPLADVDLDDEVEMQRRYLGIERVRFADRLTILVDIEPATRRARIPALLLQPLVENAVKHGVATTSLPVTIAIFATSAPNGRIRIVVDDDAPKSDTAHRLELGIGLSNVRDRLRARFDEAASLVVGGLPGGGFRAEVLMPLVLL